jgi:alpha-glucosidase
MRSHLLFKRLGIMALAAVAWSPAARAAGKEQSLTLTSPDRKTQVHLETRDVLRFSVKRNGADVLSPSEIGLVLMDGRVLGSNPKIRSVDRTSVDKTFASVFYAKRKKIRDRYNQISLLLDNGLGVDIRAYDDGVAYRLKTNLQGTIRIRNETVGLNFPGQPTAYLPIADCTTSAKKGADCFHSGFEETYSALPLATAPVDRNAILPLLVDPGKGGPKVLLTESDLDDYPGMWVRPTGGGKAGLTGVFAGHPSQKKIIGARFKTEAVSARADYIASTRGTRTYPWRVLVIADRDTVLPETDIVYRLGGETPKQDWSWLRPGKSQSEWLWDNILYDVPFKAGYNNETYRYYIDFAKRFNIGYLFFDAGWSEVVDLFKLTPSIDVKALIGEARDKGLGTVLWTSHLALQNQLIPALDQFAEWGVKGVMVDFLERDDQEMVNFMKRVLEETAKRHMFVNFHGVFKPTGIERRHPNAVTREGVVAFEYNKWSDRVTPEYEVTVPFIRGVAGPLDYEPGAMRNAAKGFFKVMDAQPMSQGTRMHQASMYILYDSPYSKMGGNVSDYLREPEFTAMMASIPGLWKETRVLEAKLAASLLVLRESDDGSFWLGGMTGASPLKTTVKLDFLPRGKTYQVDLYEDGANAERFGSDWRKTIRQVRAGDVLQIDMATGGGVVGHLFPTN